MDYDPETAEDDDGDVVVASLPASNALYQPPPQLPSIISINKSKSLIVQKSSAPPIFTYPLQPPPPASVSAPPPPPTEDYIVTDRDQNSKVTISTSIAQKVHNDFEDDRNKLIEAENMKQKALASKHSTTNFISRVKKPIRGFDQDNDSDEEEFHKESEQQQKSSASESNISSVFKPPTSESVSISHVASISPVSAEDLERARNAAAQLANAARLKLQLQLQLQQQQQVADVTSSSYSKESDPNIRKRKSRWGEATSIVPITIPVSTIPPQMCNSVNSPVFASDEERQAWEKRIKEQKELQLLESRIRQAAAQSFTLGRVGAGGGAGNEKENALFQERLKEYEELASRYDEKFRDTIEEAEANNGVIEGGTFEHRKRAKEMLDTARRNLELTALAVGHHHIGDFLPKQELDKFLRRADAAKTGAIAPTESDYETHKLADDNIGYQMLLKSGWKEGSSLGVASSSSSVTGMHLSDTSSSSGMGTAAAGIGSARLIEPLNITGQTTEKAGVGVQAPHEPDAQDSEFDQYRKRMMLAYRFRPNPLNNPRRDYY